MALNVFSKCVINAPSFMFTAPKRESDFLVGAKQRMGSLSSGGTHIAIREPCCWKWHSSRLHRSMSLLCTSRWSFFKSELLIWISMCNQRTRFSKTKPKMSKESLTLPNTQFHSIAFLKVVG